MVKNSDEAFSTMASEYEALQVDPTSELERAVEPTSDKGADRGSAASAVAVCISICSILFMVIYINFVFPHDHGDYDGHDVCIACGAHTYGGCARSDCEGCYCMMVPLDCADEFRASGNDTCYDNYTVHSLSPSFENKCGVSGAVCGL